MKSLTKNQTWDLVELPAGKIPIGCKWVQKKKFKADGSIERLNARLVTKGFAQKEGVDYKEIFPSVAKYFVLSLTAQFCWNVYPMDVKSTLLNGELEEEVYMVHPKDLKRMGGNT